MKKRLIGMLLVLAMVVCMAPMFAVPSSAATALSITQPNDKQWISYSSPPRLEWTPVDGAAGYRVSIRNLDTDELLVSNKWTTGTYYTLEGKLDAAAGEYRIWVGAMESKSDPGSAAFTSSTITVYTEPEVPLIEDETYEETTYDSVTLSMELAKDNGSAITDSGFYLVRSGRPTSERVKYSFKSYGAYSAKTKGYKEMTITGLQPDTKYYFQAYAVNGVGEAVTSRHAVTTDEYECPHTSGVYTNTYPESVTYVDIGDSEQHKEVWYYHQYCEYCQEVVKEKAVKETYYEDHQFKDGVCTVCQYVRNNGAAFDHAPTLSLSIDGTRIDTTTYGTYYPGDTIYFKCIADYSDHIYIENSHSALTFTDLNGYTGSCGTFVETSSASVVDVKSYKNGYVFALAIAVQEGIPAGDYTISVTATDGVYDPYTCTSIPDTAYYAATKASVTVRVGQKSLPVSNSKDFATMEDLRKMITYQESKNWTAGKIAYVEQKFGGKNSQYYYSDYWGSLGGKGLCPRATSAMALSYLGKTAYPKYIAPKKIVNGEIVYDEAQFIDTPYTAFAEKYDCKAEFCAVPSMDAFLKMYNRYASDTTGTYSPVVIHTNYEPITDVPKHSLLIVGKVPSKEHVYWVIDPGLNHVAIGQITLTEINGKLVVQQYDYYAPGTGMFTQNTKYGAEYPLCNPGLWQYVNNTPTCTHSWGPWENNGSSSVRYCTLCETSEIANNPGSGTEITEGETENETDGSGNEPTLTLKPVPSTLKAPTLTLKAPTLEFRDMIRINAFYTAENTQNVVQMGMITYSTKVSSWSVDTAEHVIPGATYVESTGQYYVGSQGIHGKYLADTVYLAVYAKLSDGSYTYSKLAGYSATQYAASQLQNCADTRLKQLVVAMLNYGAQAQLYFGHNTAALANAALTADQKVTAYRADMVGSVPAASAAKQGSFANNAGFSSRKPAVSFEGAFSINYFFTPKYAPTGGITLYYWNEADYNAAEVLTIANATGSVKLEGSGTGQYRGDITGISAKDLSGAVYVVATYRDSSGNVWTSGVLGYSIGAYCGSQASGGGTVANLAQATAVYGYHAKAYFG